VTLDELQRILKEVFVMGSNILTFTWIDLIKTYCGLSPKIRMSESERASIFGQRLDTHGSASLSGRQTYSRDNAYVTDVTMEMKSRTIAVPAATNTLATGA
jgi:hypothetical protein